MFGKTPFILALFFGIVLVSCKKSDLKDLNISSDMAIKNTEEKDVKKRSFFVDLPIKLDSSKYIIFQVRKIATTNRNNTSSYSKRGGYGNYIENLIFKNIHTEKTHLLTTKKVRITSYEQLYDSEKKAEKIIIYEVIDTFSKDDDALTITSLYMGTNNGKLFKKISKLNEHVTDWKYIPELKKVFFRTIIDSDKNNKFTNTDDTHTIYSVSIDDLTVKELLHKELQAFTN